MITPSFGLTATERVLPKLALDFTTASLDSRVTFTRTTDATHPATYVNSSGVITAATDNQPRFDYDPVTLACKGLLIEESRTNLSIRSNELNSWTLVGCTRSVDSSVDSPDGTKNANLLTAINATLVRATNSVSISAATTYSFSIYVRAGTGNYIWMTVQDGGAVNRYFGIVVDLTTNSVTQTYVGANAVFTSAAVSNYNGVFYRVTLTGSLSSVSATSALQVGLTDAATGNSVSSYGSVSASNPISTTASFYGAQFEAGAFATSYIPTTTTAMTRNADVATMTGTNLTDWCDTTKGTILSQQVVAQFNAANTIYAYSLGSAAAVEVYAGMSTAGANQFTVVNTTNQANFAGFSAGTLNTPQKVCGYYQANKFAASANGVAGGTDVSGTVPTINKLVFGARNDGARVLNGWIQKFSYWPFTLTTSEVTSFSK